MKTKTKSHGDKFSDFYNQKVRLWSYLFSSNQLGFYPQERDNYRPEVFLKECKYIVKKLVRHIPDNLSDFSHSYDETDEQWITIS